MQLKLDRIRCDRGVFSLRCSGIFEEGVHLIWGPIGSGKSSLALCIAGILDPLEGSISKEGIDSLLMSMQFPEYHITADTVKHEIELWGADVNRVLTMASLRGREWDDPLSLSRGELKQLELTCILEKKVDLLLLDEPFGSMDCRNRHEFCSRLEERGGGITIIFSHDSSTFPRIDYLWELQQGFLTFLGTPPSAFIQWSSPPPYLEYLIKRGTIPKNIRFDDVLEAQCRIRD